MNAIQRIIAKLFRIECVEEDHSYSGFKAAYRCDACKEFLSFNQVMNSQGVCPYCGHMSTSSICATTKIVVK